MNRKGLSNVLMYSILTLIVIALIAVLIFRWFELQKEKMEIQDCMNSIEVHKNLVTYSEREIFTDIKCPTRHPTIDAKNQQKAMKAIAEDMRRCWYEWRPTDDNFQMFKGEGIFCHVCSIYDFKQKGKTIQGFETFLMRENIELKSQFPLDKVAVPYMAYFSPYQTRTIEEIEHVPEKTELQDISVINTSMKYSTMIVYISGKDKTEEYLEGGSRTAYGASGGILIGAGTLAAKIGGAKFLAALFTTASLTGPAGWIIGGIVAAGIGTYIIIDALTPEEPQVLSYIQFTQYTDDQIKNMGCQYMPADQQSTQKA